MDPGLVPELLAGFAGRTSVGAFLQLCPSAMSGPDPHASKSRYNSIDTTGPHQNCKHLLAVRSESRERRSRSTTRSRTIRSAEEEAKLDER